MTHPPNCSAERKQGRSHSCGNADPANVVPCTPLDGPEVRRKLVKMGDGSEAFCRKALDALRENRDLVPRTLDVDEMARDLSDHDNLSARLTRLHRLVERVRDTGTALGSDAMVAALFGYQLLRVAGRGQGLDGTNKELGKRFEANGRRQSDPQPRAADPV